MSRQIVWRNYFESLNCGLVGNDNPAALFWSASGGLTNPRLHIAVAANTFDGMLTSDGHGVAATNSFNIRYGVWERNTLKNCDSTYAVCLKGGHQNTSVQFNVAVENNAGFGLYVLLYGSDGNTINGERNEVRHNKGILTGDWVLSVNWNTTSYDNEELYIYRNTLKGGSRTYAAADAGVFAEYGISTSSTLTDKFGATNITVTASEIDANGNLAGAARTSYLGTHGAEIA